MFRRILTTALLAGFLGGACISVIQEFTTTPIILHAEQFEAGGRTGTHQHGAAETGEARLLLAQAAGGGAAPTQEEGWAPADGLERTVFTTMANIIAGVGFSLILVGCFALSGQAVDGRRGVLWGIGGFAVMSLAPSLGLPPEVPGAMAAELSARQGWWLLCVAATGLGLWMLVFRAGALWIAAGIALLVAPHLIGAPQPARIGGPVPPELAGHFAAASLVTAAVFWCLLGWLSGTVWRRLAVTG
jgi:cobalt transporter subunit CbtA